MASKQPAHGSSAQTAEIDVDLVAEGIRGRGAPKHAAVTVSVDANSALRVEIEAANKFDWQFDARIVDGSLDVIRAFADGDSVFDDQIPDWVKRVADVAGERLEGGRV
jgi:hypothetical protein